jgi:hypothetical protein
MIDPAARRRIAEALLGCSLDEKGFAPCPGEASHSHRTGKRDFQVMLEGAPTGRCFHSSCAGAVDDFNAKLRSMIGKAEAGGTVRPPVMGAGIPPAPVPPPRAKRPAYSPAMLKDFAGRAPRGAASFDWWRERSPLPVPPAGEQGRDTSADFLAALYRPGERVLVFTQQYSQGNFLFESGRGSFRLADRPGVSAVPSPLPAGGAEGVWFLTAPVTGEWLPNPNNPGEDGAPRLGRRHSACVTAYRYAVLESDEAPAELWLRALAQLPLPLCALYTSGGKSVHALARFDASNKSAWDALRDDLTPILCPLGADGAALTAVRLSRLPGALRHGTHGKDGKPSPYPVPRLQELLWLNPSAPAAPVLDYVPS